ncbi:hypothetical protein EW146_g7449 [Bondarzewia mesenterica]|uniref:Pinin/SDK/MemA protein domain-containing protein n=1 Tax=Bondarzewia mesenterica TaxID=1095465 RepID=A0A4S4LKR8_9AGAM|nr:hypothetical protein EW146_g7449 [Bondarzewia mesenterica]
MSTDEQRHESPTEVQQPEVDTQMQERDTPTAPAAMATGTKKRPRLDLNVEHRERKRGKSMFGLVLGTLNKAKNEGIQRNSSEAGKKRQLIEQRLQEKIRKETDSVRRAEEAKKDKTVANRKEEDLQLNDSIFKLRRTRLPLLSNFLCTSDDIAVDDSAPPSTRTPLSLPPRSHPPPLFYLPAILLPSQEAFFEKRKNEVKEAAEAEWSHFRDERTAGIEEVRTLRSRVAEEESRKKAEREANKQQVKEGDMEPETEAQRRDEPPAEPSPEKHDAAMEVDEPPAAANGGVVAEPKDEARNEPGKPAAVPERKDEPAPMLADDDDAVEY